jgi:hypothetical protein
MNTQLNELAKIWETRAMSEDISAADAVGSGNYTTQKRHETKAEVLRALAKELRREIGVVEDEEKRIIPNQ